MKKYYPVTLFIIISSIFREKLLIPLEVSKFFIFIISPHFQQIFNFLKRDYLFHSQENGFLGSTFEHSRKRIAL